MRRKIWSVLVAALALFVIAQFVPYGRDRSNPPVLGEPSWNTPATRAIAQRACFDCHSNETRWPVYARVAPVSWLVQHDVLEGRAALNFSEWTRTQPEAEDLSEKVLGREMPPAAYMAIHHDARLTDEERAQLARSLALLAGASPAGREHEPETE